MLAHRYADVNGIRLHYVTSGAGKLILFAHGFPEFWYAWAQFTNTHLSLDSAGIASDVQS